MLRIKKEKASCVLYSLRVKEINANKREELYFEISRIYFFFLSNYDSYKKKESKNLRRKYKLHKYRILLVVDTDARMIPRGDIVRLMCNLL